MNSSNNNIPLVSIGMPSFNVENYIEFSIKSVLKQSYSNFELIITDDGSSDNTVSVIKKFNDDRIRLICDDKNYGISYRLNQQISLAKGKYFVRMDADDIMFPNRLLEEIFFLESHPQIDVVGSDAVILDINNSIVGYREGNRYKKPVRNTNIFSKSFFIHPTVAGRIEFFREFKYDEELCGVEDADLWYRGFKGNNYFILNQPLLFYRDPLKFKLKTYLFRKKQGRKMMRRRKDFSPFIYRCEYVISSYVKAFLAIALHLFKFEGKIIAKRNVCDLHNFEYEKILSDICCI